MNKQKTHLQLKTKKKIKESPTTNTIKAASLIRCTYYGRTIFVRSATRYAASDVCMGRQCLSVCLSVWQRRMPIVCFIHAFKCNGPPSPHSISSARVLLRTFRQRKCHRLLSKCTAIFEVSKFVLTVILKHKSARKDEQMKWAWIRVKKTQKHNNMQAIKKNSCDFEGKKHSEIIVRT